MQTEVMKLLNIKYPIFQGGMANIAEHNLVAAVSNAGGLGIPTIKPWNKETIDEKMLFNKIN